jgi:hypothetical protein
MSIKPNAWGDNDAFEDDPSSVSYGNVHHRETGWAEVPLYEVSEATGSDYSGGTHSIANYRVLEEMQNEFPQIVTTYGGYSTYGIVFRLDQGPLPEELIEVIDALDAYPILDENVMSEVEMELQGENWESWARDDWRRKLEEEFGDEDVDELSDEDIDKLWWDAAQHLSWEIEWEQGASPYFNFDEAAGWLHSNNPDLEAS